MCERMPRDTGSRKVEKIDKIHLLPFRQAILSLPARRLLRFSAWRFLCLSTCQFLRLSAWRFCISVLLFLRFFVWRDLRHFAWRLFAPFCLASFCFFPHGDFAPFRMAIFRISAWRFCAFPLGQHEKASWHASANIIISDMLKNNRIASLSLKGIL